MKKVLKAAQILTWFNLIFWGFPILMEVLTALAMLNFALLGGLMLAASVPLNSYAALQLHRSIRQPSVKLSHQTPVGIRFVGIVALFFGTLFVVYGIAIIQNAQQVLEMVREQLAGYKEISESMTVGLLKRIGFFALVLGITAIANVVLNMRLLRWYYLVKQSDVS
jgi:hypothetical protein